jgi:hypothetical protein
MTILYATIPIPTLNLPPPSISYITGEERYCSILTYNRKEYYIKEEKITKPKLKYKNCIFNSQKRIYKL